jgi:autotransporter passenger strand-loop-strand repeat protein
MTTYTITYNVIGNGWYDANYRVSPAGNETDINGVPDWIEVYEYDAGPVIGPFTGQAYGYTNLFDQQNTRFLLGTYAFYRPDTLYLQPGDIVTGTVAGGEFDVLGGASSSGIKIEAGGLLRIYSGAFDDSALISNGGEEQVREGAIANGAEIANGGYQEILSGGSTTSTTIDSGGIQQVAGAAIDTTVNSGGQQQVGRGIAGATPGVATGTIVNSGGSAIVLIDGAASSTTLNGGEQDVYGSATGTEVDSSGLLAVVSGGTVSSTTVNSGGMYNFGSAIDTTLNSGGFEIDRAGAHASNTTVNDGGIQIVLLGASATNTIVNKGGTLGLQGGSLASDWIINFSGFLGISAGYVLSNYHVSDTNLQVRSGGTASGTTIDNGGIEYVQNGGNDIGATVNDGGSLILQGAPLIQFVGGSMTPLPGVGPETASATTINSGGFVYVYSGGTTTGATVNSGGTEVVLSGGIASTTTINGGTLELASGGSAGSDPITFVGTGGTLKIDDAASVQIEEETGSYIIALGTSHDVVTIHGNGNNTITPGSGSEFISINGSGKNNVLSGDLSKGGVVNITGGGSLKINGDANGDVEVGANSTVEIVGSDAGHVTLLGANTTVVLDQPGSFAGNIEGLLLGDKIDFANTQVASALLSGNTLTITEADDDVLTYQVSGSLQGTFFKQSDDGKGGTLLTLDTLPSFKATTGSPGAGAFANYVVVTEGGNFGKITITLSSASDVPIDVHLDAQPIGWQGDIILTDFTIPAGQTSFTIPVVAAVDDNASGLESIESGSITISAMAQKTSLPFAPGDDSVPVLVQDQINSGNAASLAGYQAGVTWTGNIITAIRDAAKISVAYASNPSVVAQAYVEALEESGIEQMTGVIVDGSKAASQLAADLQAAQQLSVSDPNAGAQAAYAAYESARVSFVGDVIKTAVTGSGALFAAGVVAGLTGVAVTAALPVLTAVVIGWSGKIAYDAYIAPIVSSALARQFEIDHPKADFVEGYIEAHKAVDIVVHGYVSGATVFEDLNGTGELAANDPSTTTDASGHFTPLGNTGSLIAFGGTDISTGLPFKGQFSAPAGSQIISPLTTLLNDLQADPSAQQKILSVLGLSSTLDLTTFDPVAAAQGGSSDGAAAEIAGAKVYDTVEMIASALAGAGGTFTASLQAAFSTLASALDGARFNLGDKGALSALIIQVAHAESVTIGQGVADAIASVIAAGNTALDRVLQTDQSGTKLLSDAAGVELVMEGAASAALVSAGGDPTKLQAIVDLFTGTNLDRIVTQAQTETQNPGLDVGPIAFDDSVSTDQNTVRNGTVSAIDLMGNAITFALDGTAPAGLNFNSDGTFSFDPGNVFKYLGAGDDAHVTFQFKVSDGNGADSTAIETITIHGLNDTPVLLAQTGSQAATAGTPFVFTLPANTFQDPDTGDQLTLTASLSNGAALPAWLTFDAATGTLKGTPGAADAGGLDISIKATDTSGLSATDTFHLAVAAPPNHAPVITSDGSGATASVIITDNTKYVDTVRAADPDQSSTIKYSIIGGQDQKLFVIDANSGALSFKSMPQDGHSYQVTVAASDGTLQDTQTIKVQVATCVLEQGNANVTDNFVFKSDFGLAIISNFDAGSANHDVLELDHRLFAHADTNASPDAVLDLIQHHSFQLGHDVVIVTDSWDLVDLRNTNLHALTAKDFVLV